MAAPSKDDEPKDRPSRPAKSVAIDRIHASSTTGSTKKRSASTQKCSGREKKARKTIPSAPSAPSARVDKGVGTQFDITPYTQPQASHTNLIEHETLYASEVQKQLAAEARGVSRKNIPWDKFCSIYLCDFSVKAQPKPAAESVQKIGEGNWEEKPFWDRLRESLSDEVHYSEYAFIRLSVLC